MNARDPVRSPLVKPVIGGLVVGSVTTSEYPLLYVFFCFRLFSVLAEPADCPLTVTRESPPNWLMLAWIQCSTCWLS